MQTFGAREKRKDAVFPLNVPLPSLPCPPVSLPSPQSKGNRQLTSMQGHGCGENVGKHSEGL